MLGRILVAGILFGLVVACEEKIGYGTGYDDGYTATINSGCKIRDSLIHGAWNNHEYSIGYARGSRDAATDIANGACKEYKR